jgi:hypothetical protein
MSKIYENCPHFKVGKCNNKINCLYVYHKTCNFRVECNDSECKFGHLNSIKKRLIVNNICDAFLVPNWKNVATEDHCHFRMNCTIVNCTKQHLVEKKHRINICKILDFALDDDDAYKLYKTLYPDFDFDIVYDEMIEDVPIISSNTSVISDIVQEPIVDSEIIVSELSKLEIMNIMLKLVNDTDVEKIELKKLTELEIFSKEKIRNNDKNIKKLMERLSSLL